MKRSSTRPSPSPDPLEPRPPVRTLRITSYGYENGPLIPRPHISFDLRNLPNPPKHVRSSQSGMHQPLQEWLFSIGEVRSRFESITRTVQQKISEVEEADAFKKVPDERVETFRGDKMDVDRENKKEDGESEGDQEEEEDGVEADEEDVAEVSVGVFCQLGKHRSVAVAERLSKWKWNTRGEWDVVIGHRDLVVERTQAHKDRARKKARDTKNSSRGGGYESG